MAKLWYTDIGHPKKEGDKLKNVDLWYTYDGRKIDVVSQAEGDYHDEVGKHGLYFGRVDHKKKQVSVTHSYSNAFFATSVLQFKWVADALYKKYPRYKIYFFGDDSDGQPIDQVAYAESSMTAREMIQAVVDGRSVDSVLDEKDTGYYVPDHFYLVFDTSSYVDENMKWVDEVKSGRMKGVSGVGGPEVVKDFGYRGGVLVMPGDAFIKLNKLSRIQYENPEYMVSKNLEALFRVFDKKPDKWGWEGVIRNLFDYMARYGDQALKYAQSGNNIGGHVGRYLGEKPPRIRNYKHFVKIVYDAITSAYADSTWSHYKSSDWKFSDFKKWVDQAFQDIARIYGGEAEWRIKNKDLRVPKGSELWLLVDGHDRQVEQHKEWKAYVDSGEQGLPPIYAEFAYKRIEYLKTALRKLKGSIKVKVKDQKKTQQWAAAKVGKEFLG